MFINGFFPFFVVILLPEDYNIGSMCCNFTCGKIVKFKYILNYFLFAAVDCALFSAGIDHHADFFFRDLFIVAVRIDMHKPQDSVC